MQPDRSGVLPVPAAGHGLGAAAMRPVPAPEAPASCRRRIHVVAVGGGTGLPVTLQGLSRRLFAGSGAEDPGQGSMNSLTAVVTVADDGGSSGVLRRRLGIPPPGDVRSCLLALSRGEPVLKDLFRYRFRSGELRGHSLGNLILAALTDMQGDFLGATECAARILGVLGRVLPATEDDVTLCAEYDDGSRARGEVGLRRRRRRIRRIWLDPEGIRTQPEVLEAVERADLVVLGPGSLYTSILPVLLQKDLAQAIGRSRARVALVVNLMTEAGETDGYRSGDFVAAIQRHAPHVTISDALVNTADVPRVLAARHAACGSLPVIADAAGVWSLGCRPVLRNFLAGGDAVRHDPGKLARALVEGLAEGRRGEIRRFPRQRRPAAAAPGT